MQFSLLELSQKYMDRGNVKFQHFSEKRGNLFSNIHFNFVFSYFILREMRSSENLNPQRDVASDKKHA